ncbi:hypothetical protein, partial [Alcanivorax sp. S71-1-4]|uniref:hypothetical protein n=1 Tax=Alcanivorax sp. S71-1-4 TaxID=1177159 RepID=UPI001F301BA7
QQGQGDGVRHRMQTKGPFTGRRQRRILFHGKPASAQESVRAWGRTRVRLSAQDRSHRKNPQRKTRKKTTSRFISAHRHAPVMPVADVRKKR